MKIIRRIITINFLFILFLIPSAYAQTPTTTPETIGPINFEFIDSLKDALLDSDSTTPLEPGETQSMAAGSAASSSIPTITWDGGGGATDYLASTGANWSGNIAPKNGDGVVFDSTAKNCTWDLPIILASLSIKSGYNAQVTLTTNLTISEDFIWTGLGNNNLASNPANWSRNAVPENGYKVIFNGASVEARKNCTWDISVSPSSFTMETGYTGSVILNEDISLSKDLNISGGTLNLNGFYLTVDGYLLIAQGAALNASSSTITVKGDWLNAGTFNYGQSTVILNGTGQTIYGDTTFYNLEKTAACPGDTLYFEAGSLQTILGRLTLRGAEGCLLALRSTVDGQQWQIDPRGTRNISYTSIKDMNNINFVDIVAIKSVNAGGNSLSVKFGGSQCVCLDEKLLLTLLTCRKEGV